jgi:hypothetical protein
MGSKGVLVRRGKKIDTTYARKLRGARDGFSVVYASLLLSSLFSLGGGLVCNGMMGDGRWANYKRLFSNVIKS